MKLFEFEGEGTGETYDEKYDMSLQDIITTHCSDILKIYRQEKKVLYRGILFLTTPDFIGDSPVNRQPKDTNRKLSAAIDEKLADAGFTALRSNSIFCSSNIFAARNYGQVYVIFPMNGFSFNYCRWDDLTAEIPYNALEVGDLETKEFIKFMKYKQTDIAFGIYSEREVCIHGKYVAVNLRKYPEEFFSDLLGFNLGRI